MIAAGGQAGVFHGHDSSDVCAVHLVHKGEVQARELYCRLHPFQDPPPPPPPRPPLRACARMPLRLPAALQPDERLSSFDIHRCFIISSWFIVLPFKMKRTIDRHQPK